MTVVYPVLACGALFAACCSTASGQFNGFAPLDPADASRVEVLCQHLRESQLADGYICQVPYSSGYEVGLHPYFDPYALVALLAEIRIDPENSDIRDANLTTVRNWLVAYGRLMAPNNQLSESERLFVDYARRFDRQSPESAPGEDDTLCYFVPQPVNVTRNGDSFVNPVPFSTGVDADDAQAGVYLLIAGLYAQHTPNDPVVPEIQGGVLAALAILERCHTAGLPYEVFMDKASGYRLCLDNIEVHYGLAGAMWYFEKFGDSARLSRVRELAADLVVAIHQFRVITTEGDDIFTPVPFDTGRLDMQPAHGNTNLVAIARVLQHPGERDALYSRLRERSRERMPIDRTRLMEFGFPDDASRTSPETTLSPYWAIAAAQTSLTADRAEMQDFNRQRADHLVSQADALRGGNNFPDNYVFRDQEHGLCVLGLLAFYGEIDELPKLPYVCVVEGDEQSNIITVLPGDPHQVWIDGVAKSIPVAVRNLRIAGRGQDAVHFGSAPGQGFRILRLDFPNVIEFTGADSVFEILQPKELRINAPE
ncbi:MAG: hypothetical protein R3B90_04795 [Planctomycetaceae bacterium]